MVRFSEGSPRCSEALLTSLGLTCCQPVGAARFELAASCSQSRRANQTTLRPVVLTHRFYTTVQSGFRPGVPDRVPSVEKLLQNPPGHAVCHKTAISFAWWVSFIRASRLICTFI